MKYVRGGMQLGNIKRMFPGGNTSEGFYSLHRFIMGDNANKIFILKGGPGGGKSSLMSSIANEMIKLGYSIEYHHCPSDENSIDGIVIEELGVGILDGTAPHVIDPNIPGILDKIINLGDFIDESKLIEYKEEIVKAKNENKKCYRKTYAYFRAAKEIYKEIEENNSSNMNFSKVNKLTYDLIENIYNGYGIETFIGKERHLFSSAYTPGGLIEHIDTILENAQNIYYIKGDIGTGKTTLMQKIMHEGLIRGLNVETYHNPLIPSKIETIVIPEVKIAVTASKAAAKYNHEEIDLDAFLNKGLKNQRDYEILEELISEGVNNLKEAKKNHDILEKCYAPSMDFQGVNKKRDDLLKEILSLH